MARKQTALIPNLDKYSDNDLTKLLLSNNGKDCPKAVKDEIFKRYYKQFDQAIGWILKDKGIPYKPNEEYYTTVFTEIHERIFSSSLLEDKISLFDFNEDFEKWFLRLIRGEVRNWLRKLNTESKLSNLEILKGRRAIPIGRESKSTRPIEEGQRLLHIIRKLPNTHRVLLGLRFIGYNDLEDEDIEYIFKTTTKEKSNIEDEARKLQGVLINSERYKQSEKIELRLLSLKLKSDKLEKKIFAIKEVLENLGYPQETLEGVLGGSDREAQLVGNKDNEDWINLKLDTLKKLSLQYNNTTKKREKLIQTYFSGKHYVKPEYKEIAAILEIKEGTVGSRKNRAKEALWEAVHETRQGV